MWTRGSHQIAHYQPGKENSSQRYETASLASIQRAHRQKEKGTQWPLTSWSKSTHMSTGRMKTQMAQQKRLSGMEVEGSISLSTTRQPSSTPFQQETSPQMKQLDFKQRPTCSLSKKRPHASMLSTSQMLCQSCRHCRAPTNPSMREGWALGYYKASLLLSTHVCSENHYLLK